jgi:hypothetical protein
MAVRSVLWISNTLSTERVSAKHPRDLHIDRLAECEILRIDRRLAVQEEPLAQPLADPLKE